MLDVANHRKQLMKARLEAESVSKSMSIQGRFHAVSSLEVVKWQIF
ncbi:hypothetical protein LCUFL03_190039 [Latilactobacillus curvatus]|nr:hypothetical protein LCUFL03_190039 [Latilactobacillus curvatus]